MNIMNQTNRPIVSVLEARPLVPGDTLTFELYVPDHTCDGDPVFDYYTWVRELTIALCTLAGGCTRTDSHGYWVRPGDGRLVTERTARLRVTAERSKFHAGLPALKSLLVQYRRECQQHTVAFELDGELFGIEGE